MNVGSTGGSQMSSLAGTVLKNAMNGPQQYQTLMETPNTQQQFLELLESSIAVKNSVQVAQGIGMNVDTTA